MAEPIHEGALRRGFPDPWLALKFDDTAWYRQAMKSRVKAVDVIACRGQTHWWIEVKDCLGYEPESRPRLSPGDPPEPGQHILPAGFVDSIGSEWGVDVAADYGIGERT